MSLSSILKQHQEEKLSKTHFKIALCYNVIIFKIFNLKIFPLRAVSEFLMRGLKEKDCTYTIIKQSKQLLKLAINNHITMYS